MARHLALTLFVIVMVTIGAAAIWESNRHTDVMLAMLNKETTRVSEGTAGGKMSTDTDRIVSAIQALANVVFISSVLLVVALIGIMLALYQQGGKR